MRFVADGVDIPDELLWAHDEGRVVFFCGAGVSMAKAHLPSFASLTQNVMERLGVQPGDDARRLYAAAQRIETEEHIKGLATADRIFGQLRRSFDDREIGRAVAECLITDKDVDLSAHRTILKLARLQTGETRLVTTNFDLLFERAGQRLTSATRSNLPHIEFNSANWGIVHLHGMVKLDSSGPTEDGFVLSSAEFGDAYLSLGWARDFVRKVLERYVAVFIGYSADDPPVRYLLEGLQQTKGLTNRAYAFQSVPDDEAVAAWDEKGVDPITFGKEIGYDALWRTLEAWGERAKNPQRWRQRILTSARKGPKSLQPHERGMVAHIVSSTAGALAFSEVRPPLPSEWLCVFDPQVRYGEPAPELGRFTEGPIIDPHVRYGLDSDLPQRAEDKHSPREGRVPDTAWSALEPGPRDLQGLERYQIAFLRGHYAQHLPALPTRISHLASWVTLVANQPACAWWAGLQGALHPDILDRLRTDHEKKSDNSRVHRAVSGCWRTIREYQALRRDDRDRAYELKLRAKASGWHEQLAREYASHFSPFLKLSAFYRRPVPPTGRGKITERDLVHVEVDYSEGIRTVEVPDDYLIPLIGKLRQALELASDLERRYSYETDICSIEPDARDPDEGDDSFHRQYHLSGHSLLFIDLFKRLAQLHPKEALKELRSWRGENPLFCRFRVWALGNLEIAGASEFAAELLAIDDDAFWPFKGSRDLLLGMSKRWHEFSDTEQMALEKRILKGPRRSRSETKERHSEHAAFHILNRLHWLSDQGCQFHFDLAAKSTELQQLARDWQAEFSKSAARSHDGGGGAVRVETRFDQIDGLQPGEIIPHILSMERRPIDRLVEFDPFLGLSKDKPEHALRALDASYSAEDAEFHGSFWHTFLRTDLRKDDTPEFTARIARSLLSLSDTHFAAIALSASGWFEKKGAALKAGDSALFESTWQKFLNALTAVEAANASSLVREDKAVDWATEAINSPAGKLAEFLISNTGKGKFDAKEGMPHEWRKKAEQLLVLPGDSRRFALVIFGYQLGFLYFVDPQWTEQNLLSAIEPHGERPDQEALWAGFFWRARVPSTELFERIKGSILALLEGGGGSRKHHLEVLAGMVLAGWGTRRDDSGERLISSAELRGFLIRGGAEFRQNVLWTIKKWSAEDEWSTMVPEFLRDVWPKQKSIRTKEVSGRLVDLALSQKSRFSEVAKLVAGLVSKVDDQRVFIPELRKSEETVAAQYPDETLDLLYAVLAENARLWPYGAREAIEVIGQVKPALTSHPKFIALQSRLG